MTTKEIGDMGENVACRYLEEKDYDILCRNYRTRFGEADIIAKDDEVFVFVEVKTRRNNKFGEPSEAVNYYKQQRIKKVAMSYTDTINNDIRFDVIEVFYAPVYDSCEITRINHIENAF